ncbi:SirB1 family protein [Gloeothece citriformis]|nr:transglutaminase-like domain-containing protein [Gloeothece citriformis]
MNNFYHEVTQPDHQINLAKACLLIASQEYPTLDLEEYLNALDTMGQEIEERLPASSYPLKIIQTINDYLFKDLGFKGNTTDYYDPRNSFLNDVIDRRIGIPITLSVVYLELAKRLNFPMVGIGMPGHFMIRPDFEEAGIFVDVFNRGEILFEQDCEQRLQQVYQQPVKLEPHFLDAVTNQQILGRILTNLKYIYLNRQEFSKTLKTIEQILLIFPNHPLELRDKGLIYYQLGQWEKASQDLKIYLALLPDAQDATVIRQLLQQIS